MSKYEAKRIEDYICSYSGIDGGNIKARIWICGLEYGGSSDETSDMLPFHNLDDLLGWDDKFHRQYKSDIPRWPYHRGVAKLMTSMLHRVSGKSPGVHGWEEYRDHILYRPNGNEFKLNLFPIPFARLSSRSGLPGIFRDKNEYYNFCRQKESRFGLLNKLMLRLKPKLIIATGISHRFDFANAFGFEVDVLAEKPILDKRMFIAKQPDCTLAVIPFFTSRFGLNSDKLIGRAGEVIVNESGIRQSDFSKSF